MNSIIEFTPLCKENEIRLITCRLTMRREYTASPIFRATTPATPKDNNANQKKHYEHKHAHCSHDLGKIPHHLRCSL